MPSTAIRDFDYDPATHELRVTFVSGRTYVYADVPPAVFADFKAAESKGGFFNRSIRDLYRFYEITGPWRRPI